MSGGGGVKYYLIGIEICGMGWLMSGMKLFVRIVRCKTPRMKFMEMGMLSVRRLIRRLMVILALGVLSVGVGLMSGDRIFGSELLSVGNGGMGMVWANLLWVWGEAEVYMVILGALGM